MLVPFRNNWIQKMPRTAKLDSAYRSVQFGSPQNFSYPVISKLPGQHVVLLHALITGKFVAFIALSCNSNSIH